MWGPTMTGIGTGCLAGSRNRSGFLCCIEHLGQGICSEKKPKDYIYGLQPWDGV